MPPRIAELIQRLRALGAAEAEEIAARFPDQLRRVGGYNIEVLTPAARRAGRENLARLLVGSEGTLAFSAAIQLTLQPAAAAQGARHLPVPELPRRDGGGAAPGRRSAPMAVELVDRTMIDLGRGIPIYRADHRPTC